VTNICALSALWVGPALAPMLLATPFKAPAAPHEIAVSKAIASAVISRGVANSFSLPCLPPQVSASKRSAQAALRPAAEGEG